MKKHKNIIFIIFLCSIFSLIFFSGEKTKSPIVEDLDIYLAAGVGINKNGEGDIRYRIPATSNIYKEDESVESVISTGEGITIGKTRENRQNKITNKLFFGLTKFYLIEEEYAKYGIRPLIDINFKSPVTNHDLFLVVCKGRSEEYFNYNSLGYSNSAEYISDMIKNLSNNNFFKENYTLRNAILSMDAEGKNVVCPYIEIKEDGFKITGMAVFKRDKLAAILNIQDTKIMNMLRNNKVKGILTIQENADKYVNYEAECKRKIRCNKIGDKYTFIIDLNLHGNIINNELYQNISEDIEVTQRFELNKEKQVEEMCTIFLGKMKNEYKVDCLQLGWVAAAKYGRDTGVDWDEVVSNSDIKINVKVRVDKIGRGQY